MPDDITYDRPVKAKLVVRLEGFDEWEATPEDLSRFGYGKRLDIYVRAARMLAEGLGLDHYDDLTDHVGPNLIRYLIECAVLYDHSPWADASGEPWSTESAESFREDLRLVLLRAEQTEPGVSL